MEFEIATSVDWIKNVTSRALESFSLNFTVEENITQESREGFITIASGDLKQEIKIVQLGRVDFNQILITHTCRNFIIPIVTGYCLQGIVAWGDGYEESYQTNLSHQYAEEKTYILQMDLWGAEEMEIPSLVGIEEIDFSKF